MKCHLAGRFGAGAKRVPVAKAGHPGVAAFGIIALAIQFGVITAQAVGFGDPALTATLPAINAHV